MLVEEFVPKLNWLPPRLCAHFQSVIFHNQIVHIGCIVDCTEINWDILRRWIAAKIEYRVASLLARIRRKRTGQWLIALKLPELSEICYHFDENLGHLAFGRSVGKTIVFGFIYQIVQFGQAKNIAHVLGVCGSRNVQSRGVCKFSEKIQLQIHGKSEIQLDYRLSAIYGIRIFNFTSTETFFHWTPSLVLPPHDECHR